MTLKEFKIQRALGIAENSYKIIFDGFFGKVAFDSRLGLFGNDTITIPYWLSIKMNTLKVKKLPSQDLDLLFDYIEEHLK